MVNIMLDQSFQQETIIVFSVINFFVQPFIFLLSQVINDLFVYAVEFSNRILPGMYSWVDLSPVGIGVFVLVFYFFNPVQSLHVLPVTWPITPARTQENICATGVKHIGYFSEELQKKRLL